MDASGADATGRGGGADGRSLRRRLRPLTFPLRRRIEQTFGHAHAHEACDQIEAQGPGVKGSTPNRRGLRHPFEERTGPEIVERPDSPHHGPSRPTAARPRRSAVLLARLRRRQKSRARDKEPQAPQCFRRRSVATPSIRASTISPYVPSITTTDFVPPRPSPRRSRPPPRVLGESGSPLGRAVRGRATIAQQNALEKLCGSVQAGLHFKL